MRVGLLTYGLDRVLSGITRYTVELTRALAALPNGPELVSLTTGAAGSGTGPNRLRRVPLPGCRFLPGLMTLGNLWIPALARRYGLDVVHDPTGVTPFLFGADGARTVATVHDVFAWSVPGHSTVLDTLVYRRWLPHMLPRVDAVIADSQVSKRDIVRYLGLAAESVTVVYPGVSAAFKPVAPTQASAVAEQYGLARGYILHLGSIETRKNIGGLLRAYARLRETGAKRLLVVAGIRRGRVAPLEETLRQFDLGSHVRFTGCVPDEDLPALYSAADLFVSPSLYEGFGLPPLEAMACGTPVICSNAGSLPEVVGDAALTVDPHNFEGLASAMRRVLTDADLWQDLRQRGLARARRFSWERAARQTAELYEEVLGTVGTAPTESAGGTQAPAPTEGAEAVGSAATTNAGQPSIPCASPHTGGQINPRPARAASP